MSPEAEDLPPKLDAATQVFKALSHPARLLICWELLKGERSVSEMESGLGVKQPRLSRELAKLREEGLVSTRREAKAVFYSLSDDEPARELIRATHLIMLGQTYDPVIAQPNQKQTKRGGYGVFARTLP